MTDIIQNEFQNEWWEFWKDMNVCLMVTRALHLVTKTIRIYIYHLQGYFCCPCVTCQTGKKLGEWKPTKLSKLHSAITLIWSAVEKSSCLYCILFCCNLGAIATVMNRKAARDKVSPGQSIDIVMTLLCSSSTASMDQTWRTGSWAAAVLVGSTIFTKVQLCNVTCNTSSLRYLSDCCRAEASWGLSCCCQQILRL